MRLLGLLSVLLAFAASASVVLSLSREDPPRLAFETVTEILVAEGEGVIFETVDGRKLLAAGIGFAQNDFFSKKDMIASLRRWIQKSYPLPAKFGLQADYLSPSRGVAYYVFEPGGKMVQERMLELGVACVERSEPFLLRGQFDEMERSGREAGRGLWAQVRQWELEQERLSGWVERFASRLPASLHRSLEQLVEMLAQVPEAPVELAPPGAAQAVFEGTTRFLGERIRAAKSQVILASFSLPSPETLEALKSVARRSRATLLIDGKALAGSGRFSVIPELIEAGIDVLPIFVRDGVSANFHEKWTVIDGSGFWVSSANPSSAADERQMEDGIWMEHPALASQAEQWESGLRSYFCSERDYMWVYMRRYLGGRDYYAGRLKERWNVECASVGKPGHGALAGARFKLNSALEVHRSIASDIRSPVVSAIRRARSEILIANAAFGDPDVVRSLVSAKTSRPELEICVVMGHESALAEHATELAILESAGVRVLKREKESKRLHHKFAVVDGGTLLMGSANYSVNAIERNFEILLVARDRALAGEYRSRFRELAPECVTKGASG